MAKVNKESVKRSNMTETLYTYATPTNVKWVKKEAKKRGYKSYSAFVNHILTESRLHGGGSAASGRKVG